MNEEIIINLLLIKGFKTTFESEKRNFDNLTYTNFNSSYIKRCSDKYVSQMSNKLSPLYEKIKNKYTNINDWWTLYNDNVDALEEVLSSEMRNHSTLDASVSSYVRTLPELEDYDIKLAGIINSNLISSSNNEIFNNSTISNSLVNSAYIQTNAVVVNERSNIWDNIRNTWKNETVPWLVNTAQNIRKVQDSVSATIGTFITSIGEGISQFGESIADFALVAGSGLAQAENMKAAQDQLMFSVVTGNGPMYTYDNAMETNKNIQDSTMATVSKKYVETWLDEMYDNTNYGKALKNNSYAFDTVRNIGVGVGYTTGVVATTALTFGAGGGAAAIGGITSSELGLVATVAGVGKGTQNAWSDGATYEEGVSYGLLNGVWEGAQFYLGGEIGSSTIISNKFLNSALRVVMDGVDSGAEGIVQPLLGLVYKDGYTDENGNYIEFRENDDRYTMLFNEAGGWSNVEVNAVMGAGMSFIGEVGNLTKLLKPKSNESGTEVLKFNQRTNTISDTGYRLNTSIEINPSISQARIENQYLNDINTYSSQGITFDEYLANNNINVMRLGNRNDLADYMGDSKLYLLNILNNLNDMRLSSQLNSVDTQIIENLYEEYTRTSVGDIDVANFLNDIQNYLDPNQLNNCIDFIKNDPSFQYSKNQTAATFNYTAKGGLEINGWLNDMVSSKSGRRYRDMYEDIDAIQNLSSGSALYSGNKNREFTTQDGSILNELDSIIANSNFNDTIVTYRGLESLYNLDELVDVNNLSIGDTFTSSGYQSSSVLLQNCYGIRHNKTSDIILEIYVMPNSGTGAYIENISGIRNYGQTEMLIKRNATMTVVGDTYTKVIDGRQKTFIPVIVQ